MRAAIVRGAVLAAVVNLAIWFVAAVAGVVPPLAESVPTVVGVAFASVGGVFHRIVFQWKCDGHPASGCRF